MYYQLPNGKVINLDIADVLDLTDADIQMLIAMNAGEHVSNPFQGSVIKGSGKHERPDYDPEDEEIDDVEYHEMYYDEYFGSDIIDEDGFDVTDLDPSDPD
jgi:hypothetical protein